MPTKDNREIQVVIAVLAEKVDSMSSRLEKIDLRLDEHYVSQKEFKPVKTIVYGLVGIVMIGVLGAVIDTVVQNGGS